MDDNPLIDVVAAIIERRRDTSKISPSWIATEAMLEIDPDKRSPDLVRLGCHLELRQIARSLLRKHFEPDDEPEMQPGLFPDLQWRYPTARPMRTKNQEQDQEPEYVLREDMTDDDVAYNVGRLRAESLAKLKHADALEAWGRRRSKRVAR